MPKRKSELPGNRVSLVLYGESFAFCQVMARIKGTSVNGLINDVINEYMAEHHDTYQKALALMDEAGV